MTETTDPSCPVGSALVLKGESVLTLAAKSFRTDEGAPSGDKRVFLTDSETSSQKRNSKDLVAVDDSWLSGGVDGSLSGSMKGYDQFEANKKFGVKSSYDENLYTTRLDKSKVSAADRARAERLSMEIERSDVGGNIHMMEERGLKVEGDFDEEDLYSGVMVEGGGEDRKGIDKASVGKYVAPGRRGKAQGEMKEETKPSEPEPDAEPAAEPATEAEHDAEAAAEPAPPAEKPLTKKLSASAKEFTFNPGAATFTPGGAAPPQPIQQMPPQVQMPPNAPHFPGGFPGGYPPPANSAQLQQMQLMMQQPGGGNMQQQMMIMQQQQQMMMMQQQMGQGIYMAGGGYDYGGYRGGGGRGYRGGGRNRGGRGGGRGGGGRGNGGRGGGGRGYDGPEEEGPQGKEEK